MMQMIESDPLQQDEPHAQGDEQERQDELDQRLQALASSLLKKRDEAVEGRAASGIERQWREDQAAFDGKDGGGQRTDMIDFATGDAFIDRKKSGQQQRRSRVVVNIIRGKCTTAEGRFCEILLPTDDRNWGIKPTPVVDDGMYDVERQPQPGLMGMNMPQPAAAPIPPPNQQAQSMGVQGMLGGAQGGMPPAPDMASPQPAAPMPQPGVDAGAQQLQPVDRASQMMAQAKKRATAMQDVIDDQLSECQFNAECRKVVRSAVRLGTGILKGPNIVKTIRRAWREVTEGPDSVHVMESIEKLSPASKWVDNWNVYPDPHCGSDPKRGAYIFERDHILPREVEALIGIPGYQMAELIKVLSEPPKRLTLAAEKESMRMRAQTIVSERGAPYERWEYNGDIDKDDLMALGCNCPPGAGRTFSACVVFINDRPVKVQLNNLDSGELPYDFFQWVPQDNDSPWGIGEPRKLIWQQRIITGAWRAMMDNAGDSAGAQIVVSRDIEPEDGNWEVTGKKIWIDEREDGDVKQAFAQYQIANNQPELQNIIELALRFADLESGTPAIQQGEQGAEAETLGGLLARMSAADTGRRQQVKQWDDQITSPHIRRYYDWNMQYNKRRDIKGDYEVDARGTSVLLVKDENAKMLLQLLQMRADPEVEIQVDWSEAIRQLLQALHLDVLKPADQVEQLRKQREQAPPPVAPQVEVAQINAKARAEDAQQKLAFQAAEAEKARAFTEHMAQFTAAMDAQITEYEKNGDASISAQELKAMLAKTTMSLQTQKELSYMAAGQKAMQPPTEPAGRAKPGHAFEQ